MKQPHAHSTPRLLVMFFWSTVVLSLVVMFALVNPYLRHLVDPWLLYPLMAVIVSGTISHACVTLGNTRAFLLLGLAAGIGFLSEVCSLHGGTVFGALYVYRPTPGMLLGVPFEVIFFWAVFIYAGYSLTNAFLYTAQLKKPQSGMHPQWFIVLCAILDALFVTAIDVVMDPVKVAEGAWSWTGGDYAYFGIPFGNFVGWFFVAFLVCSSFRSIEYVRPQMRVCNPWVYAMPSVMYLLIGFGCMAAAWALGLHDIVLIACFVLLFPALLNLGLYFFTRKRLEMQETA